MKVIWYVLLQMIVLQDFPHIFGTRGPGSWSLFPKQPEVGHETTTPSYCLGWFSAFIYQANIILICEYQVKCHVLPGAFPSKPRKNSIPHARFGGPNLSCHEPFWSGNLDSDGLMSFLRVSLFVPLTWREGPRQGIVAVCEGTSWFWNIMVLVQSQLHKTPWHTSALGEYSGCICFVSDTVSCIHYFQQMLPKLHTV